MQFSCKWKAIACLGVTWATSQSRCPNRNGSWANCYRLRHQTGTNARQSLQHHKCVSFRSCTRRGCTRPRVLPNTWPCGCVVATFIPKGAYIAGTGLDTTGRFQAAFRQHLLLARQVARKVMADCPDFDLFGRDHKLLQQALADINKELLTSDDAKRSAFKSAKTGCRRVHSAGH